MADSHDGWIWTQRLLVRPARARDRSRFVDLFCDEDFMAFGKLLNPAEAEQRFDHMLKVCQMIPFGKQPIVERHSGQIIGYAGADYIDFDGRAWLEWGYRLVPQARGRGYATEASEALLAAARRTEVSDLLAIIDPHNLPSQRVCFKLGFNLWQQATVDDDLRNLYTLRLRDPAK